MHKEANYLSVRSLRESGAGLAQFETFELSLSDPKAFAAEFVEFNPDSYEVAARVTRREWQGRRLSERLDILDLYER